MPAGPYLRDNGEPVHLPEPIPSAFKLAVEPIARGEEICKFGHRIGTATEDIAPGRQVHVHNLASAVGDRAEGEP
jgi:altronate hydrolase